MKRRSFIGTVGAAAAGSLLPGALANCTSQMPWRGRPNIVLIMADDLGYGDLSITGRTDYATPSIDAIGREGVFLRHAYSAAPVCTPTRVALATGRYPARSPVGLYEPLTVQKIGLPPDPPTLAKRLKGVGYETALIGKWHLGLMPPFHPAHHGYDDFYGFLGAAVDYRSHVDTETHELMFYDGAQAVRPEGYLTDLLTERAVSYVSRAHSAPFFLNLQYNAPHWPWQGRGDPVYPDSIDADAGGSPAIFARMMESLDQGVGKIMSALRAHGLEDRTLVIFTSDNGGERFSHMGAFSKSKMTLWEGGIRVAALARWPGVIPAGSTSDQVAVTMDWTATALRLAGARAAAAAPLDGIDIIPALTANAATRERELFWRTHQRSRYKAMRRGDWKYLHTGDAEHLFNLVADPGEKTDQKTAQLQLFNELKQRYAEWEQTMLAPIPLNPADA